MNFNFGSRIFILLLLVLLLLPIAYSQFVPPREMFCVVKVDGKIHKCTDPILKFSYPANGSHVTNVITLSAGLVNPKFDPNRAKVVAFEYSFDGKIWHPIEDQTANVFARQWESHWNLSGVHPGPALIRIMLVDVEGKLWQDVIQFNVNLAPQTDMQISRDRSNLILDARQSFDEDGKILDYEWLVDTD